MPKFHNFIVSEKGNERRGFVEETQYRKLQDAAREPWLRGLLALAYSYGFRKAELLEMKCSQVDLLNNTVSLYSGETKNGEPRVVYLTEEYRVLLTELRKGSSRKTFSLPGEMANLLAICAAPGMHWSRQPACQACSCMTCAVQPSET